MECLLIIPFTEPDVLKEHILKKHIQRHVCEICGKSYRQERILECHVKTEHSDVKEFFCDMCGKGKFHNM